MEDKITTEDRIKNIEIDLKHIKGRMDLIAFYMQKIDKKGIKVMK